VLRKVKQPNNSTMNRICAKFDDIPNINMNLAGVAPFNISMMLPPKPFAFNGDAVLLFEGMDNTNRANQIIVSEEMDAAERNTSIGYDFIRDQISEQLIHRYGSLEAVYPSIVTHLFNEEGIAKNAHKQMFWRVFGNIALRTLEQNLIACRICPDCGAATPIWCADHACKNFKSGGQLLFNCVDCGKILDRKNNRQLRCPECQKLYRQKTWREYKQRLRKKAG